jgi:hypothetical protein
MKKNRKHLQQHQDGLAGRTAFKAGVINLVLKQRDGTLLIRVELNVVLY